MIVHQDNTQEASGSAFSETNSSGSIFDETFDLEPVEGEKLAPSCCHYWIIETANGPISRGQCQYCHEFKDFKNSVFDTDREEQNDTKKLSSGPNAAPESLEPGSNGTATPPEGIEEPAIAEQNEASELPEIVVA